MRSMKILCLLLLCFFENARADVLKCPGKSPVALGLFLSERALLLRADFGPQDASPFQRAGRALARLARFDPALYKSAAETLRILDERSGHASGLNFAVRANGAYPFPAFVSSTCVVVTALVRYKESASNPPFLIDDAVWDALDPDSQAYIALDRALRPVEDEQSSIADPKVVNAARYLADQLMTSASERWTRPDYDRIFRASGRARTPVVYQGATFPGFNLSYYRGTAKVFKGTGAEGTVDEGARVFNLFHGSAPTVFSPEGRITLTEARVAFRSVPAGSLRIDSTSVGVVEVRDDGSLLLQSNSTRDFVIFFSVRGPQICSGYFQRLRPKPAEIVIAPDNGFSAAELAKGQLVVKLGTKHECARDEGRSAFFYGRGLVLRADGSIERGVTAEVSVFRDAAGGADRVFDVGTRVRLDEAGRFLGFYSNN